MAEDHQALRDAEHALACIAAVAPEDTDVGRYARNYFRKQAKAPLIETPIVGWMVGDSGAPAMYNVHEREKAFDAAHRWGCAIVALAIHPKAPEAS